MAIEFEPCLELVVALLAVLKAGGTYLPLDPAVPPKRRDWMLKDAGARLLLSRADSSVGAGGAIRIEVLDEGAPVAPRTWPARGTERPEDEPAEASAYVTYTSGTTGFPKGVSVSRGSLLHHCDAAARAFGLEPRDRVLQLASPSFDVAAEELFPTWAAGASVVLLPRASTRGSVPDVVELLERHRVTVANLPSSLWHEWTTELSAGASRLPTSLRLLVVGSEVALSDHQAEWHRHAGERVRLLNAYGVSEATVTATLYDASGPPHGTGKAIPIGHPLGAVRVYLLGHGLEPVAEGCSGEIHLGGAGVARGYLNRPALTALRFFPDPFAEAPGGRLFRTGDLGCRGPDGALAFLGRRDDQVKIRGVRVEPQEIEAVLAQHPRVRQAAVVVREGAECRLEAHVATDGGDPDALAVGPEELRSFLGERLPAVMVPAAIVVVPALPTTPGGKVDRRALVAAPPETPSAEGGVTVPPRGSVELRLAAIWKRLLGVSEVGREDDFFALGGHSLLAGRLVARLRETWGVDVSGADVFAAPRLADLARRLEAADRATSRNEIPQRSRKQGLPLSFQQEGVWLLQQLDPDSFAYNTQISLRLRGDLDVPALRRALAAMVRRHEVFRTSFVADGPEGRPVQRVHRVAVVRLPVVDLRSLPGDRRVPETERAVSAECRNPFALGSFPLVRWTLLRRGGDDHELVMVEHHFVHDGWSLALFLRELAHLYGRFAAGLPSLLPELDLQFADFAAWQRRRLRGRHLRELLRYWVGHLEGAPPSLDLPSDRLRAQVPSHRGYAVMMELPATLSDRLRSLSRRAGGSLFMTMLAGFQALLHRYTGREDVVVGSALANRSDSRSEPLIGMLVNAVALRIHLSGDPTFEEVQRRVREVCLGALERQELPFEKLVEALQPERDPSRNPLFQIAFSFHDSQVPELRWPGLEGEIVYRHNGSAKFDLNVVVLPRREQRAGLNHGSDDGTIALEWEASLDLFDATTVRRMNGHYRTLLEGAVANPEAPVAELPLLTAGERHQVTHEWGDGPEPREKGHGIDVRIGHWAAAAPDTVAVVAGGRHLTFGELGARADRLAARLATAGAGRGSVVAVALDRTLELPVAALAVMRSGGAYLPIDLEDPEDRLVSVLEDADTTVILTHGRHLPWLARSHVPVLTLDDEWHLGEAAEDPPPPPVPTGPERLREAAYVIYTSGSTGRPKGTALAHGGLGNLLDDLDARVPLERGAAATLWTNLGFDVSLYEMLAPLVAGGTLHLLDHELRADGTRLFAYLAVRRIRAAYLPPFLLEPFARWLADGGACSLRRLLVGVEPLDESLLARITAHVPGLRVINGYGPTEATVCTTLYGVPPGPRPRRRTPIGRPVTELRVRLLDAHLLPVPAGVPGELCVGGAGVASGYRGRPDLTASAFVPDPGAGSGDRLYRTGDLARWLTDGNLLFAGRRDRQLKVRGFRVEPGEIEAALRAHPGVAEAAVVAAGEGRLAAFLVETERGAQDTDLRRHLRATIPAYMMPARFHRLSSLPLTPSAKLDRRALEERARAAADDRRGRPHGTPQTVTEEIVAGVWSAVLGVATPGREDHFFSDLGGHSLLAMRVVDRLRESFGIDLRLRTLFERPTVEALAEALDAARRDHHATLETTEPLVPLGRETVPLSFAQERLWFLDQLLDEPAAYHIARAYRLSGPLRSAALAASWKAVTDRHEPLRSRFSPGPGSPVQQPGRAAAVLPVVDLQGLPAERREDIALRLRTAEVRRAFDLAAGPPARLLLLRLGEGEHELSLTVHHIAADGWSIPLLLAELNACYKALALGRPAELPDLDVTYGDYVCWQRKRLRGEHLERLLGFWRRRLVDMPPTLDLPTDRPRQAAPSLRGARRTWRLPAPRLVPLRRLAREAGATPFMVLLAAFGLTLARHAGQPEVVVGTPVAGRVHPRLEGLIGLFVNTLVLRVAIGDDPSFRELLERTRDAALGAYEHQELPFEKLVEDLVPERHLSRTPLFQALFALQNAGREEVALEGVEVTPIPILRRESPFDLDLVAVESAGDLDLELHYACDLFDATTMERFGRHMLRLLGDLETVADRPVGVLCGMAPAERHQLLAEWNDTARGPAAPRLLHRMFERSAARAPDRLAVRFGSRSITYGELERRANRLAHRLRGVGVGVESRVGVHLERDVEHLVAILGILKAGGAWVPLPREEAVPSDRLVWMANDAEVAALVTTGAGDDVPGLPAVPRIRIVEGGDEGADPGPPPVRIEPRNLAYVVYTSGSTGRPKGSAVAHDGVASLLADVEDLLDLRAEEVHSHWTSLAFDVSVYEIFACLRAAGTLEGVPNEIRLDPPALLEHLSRRQVRHAYLPPFLLEEVLRWLERGGTLAVNRVFLGVEPISGELVARIAAHLPEPVVINTYGPSEASVAVTAIRIDAGAAVGIPLPIGRPVDETRLHVLDPALRLVPLGVVGELHIAGRSLSRGYLGRPALTAERFVPDPFAARPGGRLYRTGDRVRHLPPGPFQFLGRLDQQIKIRGFRAEPGEVEAVLREQPGVLEAVVVARPLGPGGPVLVAYVIPESGAELDAGGLREAARTRLPEPLVPAAVVLLDTLPLTATGKVDRAALPVPTLAGEAFTPPRSPVETLVAETWCALLDLDRIGVEDDFFTLGGHSLLAIRMISRLRETFAVDLRVRDVFEAPTVRGLAARVEAARVRARPRLPPIERGPSGVPRPLSFAQRRQWFLWLLEGGNPIYHIPVRLVLDGRVPVGRLAAGLRAVVRRHEVLRTRFVEFAGDTYQVAVPTPRPLTPVVHVDGLPDEAARREAERIALDVAWHPFDLERGTPFRAVLLRVGPRATELILSVHHAAADGWSMRLLLDELGEQVAVRATGRRPPAASTLQYADFAEWQRRWLVGAVEEEQLAYWRQRLEGMPPLELPVDRPMGADRSYVGGEARRRLSGGLWRKVRTLGREAGATPFMVLLAVFTALIARWTGQHDVAVGTPVANRRQREVEDLIGFFANTLVLRFRLAPHDDFRSLLGRVRAGALDAYDRQDLPFERLVEVLQPDRSLVRNPLFQVMFLLQHQEDTAVRLPLDVVRARERRLPSRRSRFDLTLACAAGDEGMELRMEYSRELFDETTVGRLLSHFEVLLEATLAQPELPLGQMPLLSRAGRHQVVTEWSDGGGSPVPRQTLHGLVLDSARRHPDAIAVAGASGEQVSYSELARRVERLARRLRRWGVGASRPVAVYLDRSPLMVEALLSILRAGAAYVPLDPEYPSERLTLVVDDSGARTVLTRRRLRPRAMDQAFSEGLRIVVADDLEAGDDVPAEALPSVGAGDLAYVLYTSGSTGRPKGVAVAHGSAVALLRWAGERFSERELSAVFAGTSINFDLSIFELFAPLASGGRVVLGHDTLSVAELPEAGGTTLLNGVPSAVAELVRLEAIPASTLTVNLAGEVLPRSLVERIRRAGALRVLNLYGPTEDTTYSTWEDVSEGTGTPGIGRPLPGTRAFVLDGHLRPAAPGVPGELFLGGRGLARGYRARPSLTAVAFVPDLLSGEPGARLYRTGDRARWRGDGRLDFLGRIDHQVKLRGFRIELGEVEAHLADHPAVTAAACAVSGEALEERLLVAFVETAGGGSSPSDAALRDHLMRRLPAYMMPSRFVRLSQMPRTPTGKLDRGALPRAPGDPHATEESPPRSRRPRTEVERGLHEIWRDLLGRDELGVDESFFTLGGHSLLAMRLVAAARDTFGIDLPLRSVFETPTIDGLARTVEGLRSTAAGSGNELVVLAEVLDEVSALSGEEVDALLARSPGPAGSPGKHDG